MATGAPGISTLGIKVGWAAGTAAAIPTNVTQLTRINEVGGISLDVEQIDASALEDFVSKYVAGRADTGGTFPFTVNLTDDTIAEWEAVFEASNASGASGVWFEIWSPYLTKAFWVFGQTPRSFPMPDMAQNSLETVEINITIADYHGLDTAKEPGATA